MTGKALFSTAVDKKKCESQSIHCNWLGKGLRNLWKMENYTEDFHCKPIILNYFRKNEKVFSSFWKNI